LTYGLIIVNILYKLVEGVKMGDTTVHLIYCYQGEYQNNCKFNEEDCPAAPIEDVELSDKDFLKDLAERLMSVPCTYGTDQYDTDRLIVIAENLKS
jgi:hypothetical protein